MTFLPIVSRELRAAVRRPATYWLRVVAALGVCLFWIAVLAGGGGLGSASRPGQVFFHKLSFAAEAACLVAGVFLTADSLSEENREGTLGLFFLTELHGYDVVLGKLVAGSVQALCAWLAVFPVLALPFLSGGVSPVEFWRVTLAMNVTLFLSLAAGLLVSAWSRETRQGLIGLLAILATISLVLPALNEVVVVALNRHALPVLFWLNPFYAYSAAFDSWNGPGGGGGRSYWMALGTQFCLSAAFLVAASLLLRRAWRERPVAAMRSSGNDNQAARFGNPRWRQAWRIRRLAQNPFYWLASRDRLSQIAASILFGAISAVALCLFVGIFIAPLPVNLEAFNGVLFVAFGLNLIFRCLVAREASRRFNEDRRSGALELILVTPLSLREILAGQRRALLRHFRGPIAVLLVINGALLWLVNGPDPIHASAGGPAAPAHLYTAVFASGMALLFFDYLALSWAGMWLGLRARQHHYAVFYALALANFAPWLLVLLVWAGLSGHLTARGKAVFVISACVACILNDLVVAKWSWFALRRNFRQWAAMPGSENETDNEAANSELEPAVS